MQYVMFLRAINVAGHATVKMTDLKDAFLSGGCQGVTTLIQSGNVIFESAEKNTAALFQNIRGELRDLLGGEPEMVTRTVRELERMHERAPFKRLKAEPDAKLYVAFLARKPSSRIQPTFPLVVPKEGLEAIAMTDREVFVVSRRKENGFYGFPNGFIEKELGVPATTRNWSTVTRIIELLKKSSISNQQSAITGFAADRPRISSSGRTGSERRK